MLGVLSFQLGSFCFVLCFWFETAVSMARYLKQLVPFIIHRISTDYQHCDFPSLRDNTADEEISH